MDKQKKGWCNDEYDLLIWAINKYCLGRKMKPKDLSKNDWVQISGFVPGRNDAQCLYRFNQEKKDQIKKCNWVKKEDDELIRIIKEHGIKHWNYVAQLLN